MDNLKGTVDNAIKNNIRLVIREPVAAVYAGLHDTGAAEAAILAVAEWLDGEFKRLDEAASKYPNDSVAEMMASRAAHCEVIAQLLREEAV